MGEVPKEVKIFKDSVTRFCLWAEDTSENKENDVFKALDLLASLLHGFLHMPTVDCTDKYAPPDIDKMSSAHIFERFGRIPFSLYFEVYNPVVEIPEEPVPGDIAEDLLDIYVDLKGGLILYGQGQVQDAVFHWKFTEDVNWGTRLTSALRVLHSFWRQMD